MGRKGLDEESVDSPSHADLVLLHPILTLDISIRGGHEALISSSLGLVADTTSGRTRAGKRKKMTCSVSERKEKIELTNSPVGGLAKPESKGFGRSRYSRLVSVGVELSDEGGVAGRRSGFGGGRSRFDGGHF